MVKIIGLPVRVIHLYTLVHWRPSLLHAHSIHRLSPFLPAGSPPLRKPAPESLFLPADRRSATDTGNALECVRCPSDQQLLKPPTGCFLFASIADPHHSYQCRIL